MSDDNNQNTSKKRALNIEITEKMAEGQYANLAIVNHSASEFILDFINVMPAMSKSFVKSRVILNPLHAKRLHKLLEEHLKAYEKNQGVIQDKPLEKEDKVSIPLHYRGSIGEA